MTGRDADDGDSSSVRVVFTPSGATGEVPAGTPVLVAARELRVDLDTVCGGRAICGRCQVNLVPGDHAKWAMTVAPDALGDGEGDRTDGLSRPLVAGRRLGCLARLGSDAVIDVPPDSQIHRPVVRKDVDIGDIELDPVVSLRYVSVPGEPDDAGTPRVERVVAALCAQWDLDAASLSVHPDVVARIAAIVDRSDAVEVTVALRDGHLLCAAWPGYVDRVLGVAVDIGSTTVAGHLCDLGTGEVLASAGLMNPQIRFGEDLMSRVSYAMLNDGGAAELTGAVREALNDLIGGLVDSVDGAAADQVLEVVVVGNPVMLHLAAGFDPTPLGQAPFPLATADAVEVAAGSWGLDLAARVYVAPCVAGHVGGDTVAAMLAEGPHRGDDVQLLVDVGTNAEIVLGSRDALWAASSPTGPAFEGAQISSGQRATTGAIDAVRVDPGSLEPRYRVIGSTLWSDDPGFADSLPPGGVTGVCGSGIVDAIAEMFLAGVVDHAGVIADHTASGHVVAVDRVFAYRLATDTEGRDILVTQGDIRAVQLAVAALRAGIELLRDASGVGAITDVRLAGAFGAHLDPLRAMVLGLIPDCPLDAVRSVGNSAGAGAVRALVSGAQRREMEELARRVVKIETATEGAFQDHFVAALAFPHETAPMPHLASVVSLPDRVAAPRERRRSRTRRSRGDRAGS